MKYKVIHLMIPEKKFTLPLKNHIINELKLSNHFFLFFIHKNRLHSLPKDKNIEYIYLPFRNFIFLNVKTFLHAILHSNKIIFHAAPLAYLFILVPWKIKKIIWVFHGGIDIPCNYSINTLFIDKISLFVKKKIKYHCGHIKEDSDLINSSLNANGNFIFCPAYLSNTWNKIHLSDKFIYSKGFQNVNILLGNSTSPENNHFESFQILINSQINPKNVISFLSYGDYIEYRNYIIKIGIEYFGERFLPITNFMSIDKYLEFLENVDCVIFNHNRSEATGITIQLLSIGKPIFFNPESSVYKSLIKRGYIVFNIYDLYKFKNIKTVDLRKNRKLLLQEYSIKRLNSFYMDL